MAGLHNPNPIVEAKMAIHSIYTLSQDDPEARNWLSFFRRRGHTQAEQCDELNESFGWRGRSTSID